ncbi:MAG TPA: DMT family transporter [Chitinophagaceae bacterium]|nr:DMT family transporter [Chitinophagaceae bacterium]
MTQNRHNFLIGFAFALLATLLWSGNFIAARGLNKSISPVALNSLRWVVATLVLLPFAYSKLVQEWKLLRPHLWQLCFAALSGVTVFNTFVYVGGKYSSATNLALIGTTAAPIFVLLITALFLKQRISLYQIIGTILCVAGIVILISGGNWEGLRHFTLSTGDIWILLAALAFAIYTVLVRKKPAGVSAISFLFAIFLLGTIFLIPALIIDRSMGHRFAWNETIVLSILYLGIGASVISFLSWNISIRRIGPARTALFGNLIPIFSTIEASILLNEEFSNVTLISLAIILMGLLIANLHSLMPARKIDTAG